MRDDIHIVLDSDSAEAVTGNVNLFIERAGEIGGDALLAELEDLLSNFLTIGPRSAIGSGDDPDIILGALISQHCSDRARGVST